MEFGARFRQIRKSREFRRSAISGEFEAALLDIQSLDSGFQGRGGDLELGGCSSGSRDAASAFSQSCFNYAPLIKRLLLEKTGRKARGHCPVGFRGQPDFIDRKGSTWAENY
jgi:hypothetical protein